MSWSVCFVVLEATYNPAVVVPGPDFPQPCGNTHVEVWASFRSTPCFGMTQLIDSMFVLLELLPALRLCSDENLRSVQVTGCDADTEPSRAGLGIQVPWE